MIQTMGEGNMSFTSLARFLLTIGRLVSAFPYSVMSDYTSAIVLSFTVIINLFDKNSKIPTHGMQEQQEVKFTIAVSSFLG